MSIKVKAGSLLIVIIISLVMAIMTSSLLMYALLMRTNVYAQPIRIRLLNNLEAVIRKELHRPINKTQSVHCYDLYADGEDTVCVHTYQWGLYAVTKIKAYALQDTVQRSFMKGSTFIPV